MTTFLGKSCSFGLPRVPFVFVNCRQFMYLVISLLVLRAGCGIWLYQFLIIAYLFTLRSMRLGGVSDVALPFPLINKLYSNHVCCCQTVFQKDHFKDYWYIWNKQTWAHWSQRTGKLTCSMMKYGEIFRTATQYLTPPVMTIIKFWKRWSFRSKGIIQAANIPDKRSQARLCTRTEHRYCSAWCSPPFLQMLFRTVMIAFQSETVLMATCSTLGWKPNQRFRQTC